MNGMTLEDAVEIVANGRYQFAVTAEFNISDDAHPKFKKKAVREAFAKWDRAKAIVDQAVRFVEAREQEWDGLTPHPGAIDEFYKLRAMQRGEEVK